MDDYYFPFRTLWISPEIAQELGKSIWLLLLLMSWTTGCYKGIGVVMGGRPLHDEELYVELGVSANTLIRYREILEASGFIRTRKVRYGLKQWFVIGYEKYRGKKVDNKRQQLVQAVLKVIANRTQAKMLNPLYSKVFSQGKEDQSTLKPNKNEEQTQNSGEEFTNSGDAPTKNGDSIIDTTTDNKGKESEEKEKGAFGPQLKTTSEEETEEEEPAEGDEIDPDILEIYVKYMKVIGSNSMFPSEQEKLLIKEAIKQESTVNIVGTIAEYDCELYIRKPRWRPVAATEFFKREFYSRFLPRPEPEPKYDDDIMF